MDELSERFIISLDSDNDLEPEKEADNGNYLHKPVYDFSNFSRIMFIF